MWTESDFTEKEQQTVGRTLDRWMHIILTESDDIPGHREKDSRSREWMVRYRTAKRIFCAQYSIWLGRGKKIWRYTQEPQMPLGTLRPPLVCVPGERQQNKEPY